MRISLSSKVALGTFIIAGIGIVFISLLSYSLISSYFKQNILDSLTFELQENVSKINNNIQDMKKDVTLLANTKKLSAIKRARENRYYYDALTNKTYSSLKQDLAQSFKSILEHNDEYFNIRFLDIKGKELVVVVKNTIGQVIIQKEKNLQDKSQREYFKEAIELNEDEVYISKINLNRENGVFSYPYIPTIRIAKPIYVDGKIFGILIINANIYKLFTPLKDRITGDKQIYIANKDGYYLYNKDKNKTFGFDLGTNYKIQDDFDLKKNRYFTKNMAFSYKKLYITGDRYIIIALSRTDKFLKEQSSKYKNTLSLYILLVSLVIALISLLLVRYFITPITKLTKKAQEITSSNEMHNIVFEPLETQDEIGELSQSLQKMVEKIEESKKEIEQKVQDRTKELNEVNENLEHIVKEKTRENIKQLELMQQQTKMASMGEMIGAIAHQWRQPLNELSISIQNLKYDYEDGLVDEKFIAQFIEKNKEVIQFMSDTIDDFRNFYRVDKTKEVFDVREAILTTISMQKAQLRSHNIEIKISSETFQINGFKNEFQQVILNLINNAKDALLEKKIKNAKIEILLENRSVIVRDNAGGIPQDILKRIFEPYFTTKEQGKGTGMGLYMSKMIIEENMDATLSVSNTKDGVEFRMDFSDE